MSEYPEIHPFYKVEEIKVTYSSGFDPQTRPKISKSKDAFDVFKSVWDENTMELCEEFKMILLNNNNRVIGVNTVSKGGLTGTIVDKRLVFATALKCNARAIILGHNHPSGVLEPSKADQTITDDLVELGRLLDLPVVDHIIMTRYGHLSMCDAGYF